MKCSECGHELEVRKENRRYDESGLPNVVLQDIEVRRCSACGKEVVAIPAISRLHKALAKAVIQERTALSSAEFKFLRKYLGWSGTDTAKHLGVKPETVSRWESGATPIGATADRLIRTCVALGNPVEDYSVDALAAILPGRKRPETRLKLSLGADKNWRAESSLVVST
jgi:putative zinc finger/helix-turn-helix YgiT family protein